MPDDPSILSKAQRDKIAEWAQEKSGTAGVVCPICRSNKWSIAEHVVTAIRVTTSGKIQLVGGAIYPYAQVNLQKLWGGVQFISAVSAGVMEEEEEPKKEPPQNEKETTETKEEADDG